MNTTNLSVLALALSASACNFSLGPMFSFSEGTDGVRGMAKFSTHEGIDCMFGCGVTATLAVGSKDVIAVAPQTAEDALRVVSTDPRVFTANLETSHQCCTGEGAARSCSAATSRCAGVLESVYSVKVEAKAAGSASLQVLHADGSELDHTVLSVATPSHVSMELPEGTPVTAAGTTLHVVVHPQYRVRMLDSNGKEMRAPGLDLVHSSDAKVAAFVVNGYDLSSASAKGVETGEFRALAAGVARIEVAGADTVTVTVVP